MMEFYAGPVDDFGDLLEVWHIFKDEDECNRWVKEMNQTMRKDRYYCGFGSEMYLWE